LTGCHSLSIPIQDFGTHGENFPRVEVWEHRRDAVVVEVHVVVEDYDYIFFSRSNHLIERKQVVIPFGDLNFNIRIMGP
jgi:hypothetical protein